MTRLHLDFKTKLAVAYLTGMTILALLAPWTPSLNPTAFDATKIGQPTPPSSTHWFGTDQLGRDTFSRAIYGARISLSIGIIAVGISISIGAIIGLTAGYFSGKVDTTLMRLVDILMGIPTIFLILTVQSMFTPSIHNIMIIIGLTSWMGTSRLIRAETLSIKERPFILAARARSIKTSRLLLKHTLPHAANLLIVSAALGMGGAILTEAVLSFLGLGVQPPTPSWGNMLQNSLTYIYTAPWLTIIPGTLITLTVLALNIIGDTMQSAINPDRYAKSY